MTIDHVIVAGRELPVLMRSFSAVGFHATFGGVHSHGTTHMGIVPFADGVYFELLAPVSPDATPPRWRKHLRDGAGLCGWAVSVKDVKEEARRLAAAGFDVTGPVQMGRERPDGSHLEWAVAVFGGEQVRSLLPFAIEDRTPRALRVFPRGADAECVAPRRVACIVLGVECLDSAVAMFQRAFGLSEPRRVPDPVLDAEVAVFGGQPVILATGVPGSWIAERTRRYGNCPCAVMVATLDWTPSSADVPWTADTHWLEVANTRLGLLS